MIRYIVTSLLGVLLIRFFERQAPRVADKIGGKKGVVAGQAVALAAPFLVRTLLRRKRR